MELLQIKKIVAKIGVSSLKLEYLVHFDKFYITASEFSSFVKENDDGEKVSTSIDKLKRGDYIWVSTNLHERVYANG